MSFHSSACDGFGVSRRRGLALLLTALSGSAWAESAVDVALRRWKSELDAFARTDALWPPAADGVLFVGSSSIRLWPDLEQVFPLVPGILQRGVGGSRLSECADLVPLLVLPYRPRMVVLYAGENDLADGSCPEEVLHHFIRFVDLVRAAQPATRIVYVSIKPSPSRWQRSREVRATNRLIAQHISKGAGMRFVDVFSPMLDACGSPRQELFLPDRLHLNADGYALWGEVLSPYLLS